MKTKVMLTKDSIPETPWLLIQTDKCQMSDSDTFGFAINRRFETLEDARYYAVDSKFIMHISAWEALVNALENQ